MAKGNKSNPALSTFMVESLLDGYQFSNTEENAYYEGLREEKEIQEFIEKNIRKVINELLKSLRGLKIPDDCIEEEFIAFTDRYKPTDNYDLDGRGGLWDMDLEYWDEVYRYYYKEEEEKDDEENEDSYYWSVKIARHFQNTTIRKYIETNLGNKIAEAIFRFIEEIEENNIVLIKIEEEIDLVNAVKFAKSILSDEEVILILDCVKRVFISQGIFRIDIFYDVAGEMVKKVVKLLDAGKIDSSDLDTIESYDEFKALVMREKN